MVHDTKENLSAKNVQESTKLDHAKDELEYEYVPPDGGWGWLVLSGSVLVSLLIPGTIKSFGILFVEFFEVFDATPVAAAWIPALTYFLYCALGPLASVLSTRYSYRTVTLLGGLFAASGMISSVFATNISHLYICYGILVGTGAGLSFPPGVFIVTSYFVRLRGLANGIAISGSALGSIILPPFLRFLLENYGFRGAVLIMGGLILNVLVGASLYDPVQQHLKKVPIDKSKKNGKHSEVYYVTNNGGDTKNGNIKKSPEEKALLDSVIFESKEVPVEKDEIILEYHASNGNMIGSVNQPLLLFEGSNNVVSKNGGSRISLGRTTGNMDSNQQISRKISTGSYRDRGRVVGSTSQISRKTSVTRPLHRVASAATMTRKVSVASNLSSSSFRYISTPFHGSTLVGLNPEFSSQITMKTPQDTTEPSSCFSTLCCCFSKNKSTKTKVQEETQRGVYWTLMRDTVFIMILISNASTAIGYTNFTILLPTYAVSLGYDKDKASYLLSVVSLFDLIGRVGGSALSDWLPISKKFYYIGGLVMSGVSLVLLPQFHSHYGSLAFFCGAFGLFSGTFVGIQAIYMVDMLGEDRLSSSYGISLFISGVLQLIGPPICGFFFEAMNSYDPVVTTLGAVLICGASIWTYFPFINKSKGEQICA